MAQVNFDVFTQSAPQADGASQDKGPDTTFKLKPDGKAIVRFLHDDTGSFDIVSTHLVQVAGRSFKQRVNCLREDHDPVDTCPLCAAGVKQESRIYVHMLQYTPQQDGTIKVEPKIWDRPIAFAYELRDKINDYGPLSQQLFIVKRTGSGPRDTRYTVDFAIEDVYPRDKYPLQAELMDEIKYKHPYLMNRNAEQMVAFLSTGTFPELPKEEAPAQAAPAYVQPAQQVYVAPAPVQQQTYVAAPTGSGLAYAAPNTQTVAYTPQDAFMDAQRVQPALAADPLPPAYNTAGQPVRQAPFQAAGQPAPIRRYE